MWGDAADIQVERIMSLGSVEVGLIVTVVVLSEEDEGW